MFLDRSPLEVKKILDRMDCLVKSKDNVGCVWSIYGEHEYYSQMHRIVINDIYRSGTVIYFFLPNKYPAVSFEEWLDQIDPKYQAEFLFHLDVFS